MALILPVEVHSSLSVAYNQCFIKITQAAKVNISVFPFILDIIFVHAASCKNVRLVRLDGLN
jgi:hypothetical protein